MAPQQNLRVAISGGGIAGASLIHGLLAYPHLDTHIFESAPAFQEVGAAIGLSENSLRALDLLSPTATDALMRAGAVIQSNVQVMLGEGPSAGATVGELEVRIGRRAHIVHRAAFLQELLADVAPEKMHASKKLANVHEDDGGTLTLTFSDGTTHECDVLIGADGIHSFVRKHILGSDPSAEARFAGWWGIQILRPFDEIQAILGEDLVNTQTPREHGWVGNGSFIMHNVTSEGALAQILACVWVGTDEPASARRKFVAAEELKSVYQHWPPNLYRVVQEVLCAQDEQMAFYFWEHAPAPTYAKGRIAVTGDAAHSTTPWQAGGAAMSLEDSLILTTLLGHTKTTSDASKALQIYDQVRRPRTQRIVKSSHETGLMLSGKHPDTCLDLGKLQEKLLRRWEFLIEFDTEQHRDEALALLQKEISM